MDPLIAEDLLLLLLDDSSGRLGTSWPDPVLGGALLIELAVLGAVEVEERSSMWQRAKVCAVDGVAVDDPLLHAALAEVSFRDRTAQDLVTRLGKGARDDLTERLVERGLVRPVERRVLGVFPLRRWPAEDGRRELQLRQELGRVLVQRLDPDDRTAALVALLSAIDKAHKVVDHQGVPRRVVRSRAKEVAEGAWAAKAVRDAIMAASSAGAAAAGSS